jgi:hypothetical protein
MCVYITKNYSVWLIHYTEKITLQMLKIAIFTFILPTVNLVVLHPICGAYE